MDEIVDLLRHRFQDAGQSGGQQFRMERQQNPAHLALPFGTGQRAGTETLFHLTAHPGQHRSRIDIPLRIEAAHQTNIPLGGGDSFIKLSQTRQHLGRLQLMDQVGLLEQLRQPEGHRRLDPEPLLGNLADPKRLAAKHPHHLFRLEGIPHIAIVGNAVGLFQPGIELAAVSGKPHPHLPLERRREGADLRLALRQQKKNGQGLTGQRHPLGSGGRTDQSLQVVHQVGIEQHPQMVGHRLVGIHRLHQTEGLTQFLPAEAEEMKPPTAMHAVGRDQPILVDQPGPVFTMLVAVKGEVEIHGIAGRKPGEKILTAIGDDKRKPGRLALERILGRQERCLDRRAGHHQGFHLAGQLRRNGASLLLRLDNNHILRHASSCPLSDVTMS